VTRKPSKPDQGEAPPKAPESSIKKKTPKAERAKSQAFTETGRGQGAYVPGSADRLLVQLGVAAGMTHEQVANALMISTRTLTRHFPDELESGADRANIRVVGNLYRIATQTQDQKAALTAAIWWTKARMGWRGDNGPAVEGGLDVPPGGGHVRFTLKIGDRGDAA
jgi:hypothetical protein